MNYNNSSLLLRSSSSNILKSAVKYIYELPYFERKELCRILDENNQWETLGGGLMCYSSSELSEFGRAVYRGSSPTDVMLTAWGNQNHTVTELFVLLARISHVRAMKLLTNFVEPKYENYLKNLEVNQNLSSELVKLDPPPGPPPLSPKEKQNFSPEKVPDEAEAKIKNNDADVEKLKKVEISSESVGLLPQIPYEDLLESTNNWERRNILGKGGFGTVFRGIWKNTPVAIKRMEQRGSPAYVESQLKQSLGELKFLNTYRHDNILPLYGYCLEGLHPCLVYQFMPNGSLEDRLLCRQKTYPLLWGTRFSITRGVACGIQFLHSIGTSPLIHGDIKSANILLDKNFEAKIGDFGLAREMNLGTSGVGSYVKVSRVHGTRPYLPDEYLRSKKLSTKVDTYSYGIMLFEVITGQRAYEECRPKKYLRDMFDEAENCEVLKDTKGGSDNVDIFWILLKLAKLCSQRLPKERPEMVQVLKYLEGQMSQQASIRTGSLHVTGLPLLFETRPASLMPTGMSTNPRLSPEMRTPSPHWMPNSTNQVPLNIPSSNQMLLNNPSANQMLLNTPPTNQSPSLIPSANQMLLNTPPTNQNIPYFSIANQGALNIPTSNQNPPNLASANQVPLANKNAPSFVSPNQNATNLGPANQNAPNFVSPNQNALNLALANQNAPNIVSANQNVPNLASANQVPINFSLANKNAPNLASANQNAQNFVSPNQNAPNLALSNQNAPNNVGANINWANISGANECLPNIQILANNSGANQRLPNIEISTNDEFPILNLGSNNDEYLPQVLINSELSPRGVSENFGLETVIPLITELGIKD